MNRLYFLSLLTLIPLMIFAQTVAAPAPIRTAVPFLSITPDAVSAGMAEIGVASTPDVYSMHHNAAKYAFTSHTSSLGVSYTPWLHNITGDMFLGYVNYYRHIGKSSAIAASLRIFSIGEVEMNDYDGYQVIPLGSYKPFEVAVDVAYSMKFSPRLGMGVALRYIRSDISERSDPSTDDFHAGNAVTADISLYYSSRMFELKKMNISYSWGVNIRDIGSRISYGGSDLNDGCENMPTTLSLGAGIHLHHKEKNVFSFLLETSKTLVPSPVWDDEQGVYLTPSCGMLEGMWSGLTKAPGGFGEKITEYSFQYGMQWEYDKRYALRTGWYYADESKGGWQALTLGASVRFRNIRADVAYSIPTARSWDENPTGGTLRAGLCFYMGRESE